jgi:hypothetical protein
MTSPAGGEAPRFYRLLRLEHGPVKKKLVILACFGLKKACCVGIGAEFGWFGLRVRMSFNAKRKIRANF